MKHRAWFTLVVRLIGLLLIGLSLESVGGFVIGFIMIIVPDLDSANIYARQGYTFINWIFYYVGSFLRLGCGVYLLFGGERLINWCLRSAERLPNSAVCIHCGYDLSMTKNKTCPECGKEQLSDDEAVSAASSDDGDAS